MPKDASGPKSAGYLGDSRLDGDLRYSPPTLTRPDHGLRYGAYAAPRGTSGRRTLARQ